MGFFDRWSKNSDGSFSDSQDDSGASSDSGGDSTPEPTQSQDQMLDGSTGGTSGGGGGDDLPDEPSLDNDNPFDDSGDSSGGGGGGGSSGSSGGSSGGGSDDASLPDEPSLDKDNPFDDSGGSSAGSSSGDSTPEPTPEQDQMLDGSMGDSSGPETGQGIGPDGVSGSEGATPEGELDAPNNDSTEGIESTQTGKLEDTADDPQVRKQAQQLEQKLTDKKVTDAVSGLKTTGAEFREEDIQVVREGDQLKAELSPVGRERVQNIADRQADEAAERAVEDELNASFTNEDVSLQDDGDIQVSQNVQNEATEQAIAANNPGVRESDIRFEDGEPTVDSSQTNAQDRVGQKLESETGLEQGEDFTTARTAPSSRVPTERGQGNVRVNITETGAQELQGRREQEQGDIFSDAVAAVERSPARAVNTAGLLIGRNIDSNASFDTPGEGSLVGRGREAAANATPDRFGEDLDIPFTDIGFVESSGRAGRAVNRRVITPASKVAGDIAGASQRGVEQGVGALTLNPDTFDDGGAFSDSERELRDIARSEANEQGDPNLSEVAGEGAARGGLSIANVPAVANTAFEAGSFTVEAGEQTLEGEGGQFARQATEAGALKAGQGAKFAAENPVRFTSQLAGGAVSSSALIRAGRFAGGPSGGRAVSAVVQPGEEAAIFAAKRGLVSANVASKVPGVRKEQFIPESEGGSGDPLVDIDIDDTGSSSTAVESTDFRTNDGGGSGGTSTTGRVRQRVSEFLDDESAAAGPGSRTRQRQRQRQRPEQEQEPVIEIDVENDPLVRARQRRQEAQASSVRSQTESDIETRVRADSRLRAAQRLETETGQTAAQTPSVGLDATVGVGLGTEQFAGTEAITSPTLALETRQQLATETAVETQQEQRQEVATETQQELATETAVESRTELATELRSETRTEADTDDLLEDDGFLSGGGDDIDTGVRRFEYNIADPDSVLSGEAGLDVDGL